MPLAVSMRTKFADEMAKNEKIVMIFKKNNMFL